MFGRAGQGIREAEAVGHEGDGEGEDAGDAADGAADAPAQRLPAPDVAVVGDEEVVEWAYGLKTPPSVERLKLDPRWADFRWTPFSQGYPLLEFETDRAAFMRLHALLRAA